MSVPRHRGLTGRAVLALVVVLLATCTGQVAAASPGPVAVALANTHVTGTVTNTSGAGIGGIRVSAWQFFASEVGSEDWPDGWVYMDDTRTAVGGTYDLPGLAPGSYRIQFYDDEETYVPEWWNNKMSLEEAQDVVVTAGAVTAKKDAQLARGSTITGTVTTQNELDLWGNQVVGYRFNAATRTWDFEGYTTTSDDGSYAMYSLPAGTYRVVFDAGSDYPDEWWNDRPSLASADNVVVPAEATVPGKNAYLSFAGPPPAVTNTTPPVIHGRGNVASLLQSSPGSWTPSNRVLSYQWLSNGSPVAGATGPTYVPTRTDVGRRISLKVVASAPGHSSRSVVTNATDPVPQPRVQNVRRAVVVGTARVGSVLRAKRDRWAPSDVKRRYQWFANGKEVEGARQKAFRLTQEQLGVRVAVRVKVTAPGYRANSSTAHATPKVEPAGRGRLATVDDEFTGITGAVTGTGGVPLDDVDVYAYVDDPEEGWRYAGEAATSATGEYQLWLGAGTYRVKFEQRDIVTEPQYQSEWWDDAATFAESDDVVLGAGETLGGQNAELSPWGRISGQVKAPGGAGVESWIRVYRYEAGTAHWSSVGDGPSNASGQYNVIGLRAGTYRIEVSPYSDQYAEEFWQDAISLEQGDDIVVGRGSVVTGISPVVNPASHITGRVTGPGGTGLTNVEVSVYVYEPWVDDDGTVIPAWETYWSDDTDSAGNYDVGGLKAGTYRVEFWDNDGDHATEYWNDRRSVETANDVSVGQSATRSGINASLAVKTIGTVKNLKVPVITGRPVVGKKLSVGGAAWAPSFVYVTYQWLADGKPIRKATAKTFVPTRKQVGKRLTVRVSAGFTGYVPLTVTTAKTKKVKPKP